jgi:hypothetical protein
VKTACFSLSSLRNSKSAVSTSLVLSGESRLKNCGRLPSVATPYPPGVETKTYPNSLDELRRYSPAVSVTTTSTPSDTATPAKGLPAQVTLPVTVYGCGRAFSCLSLSLTIETSSLAQLNSGIRKANAAVANIIFFIISIAVVLLTSISFGITMQKYNRRMSLLLQPLVNRSTGR